MRVQDDYAIGKNREALDWVVSQFNAGAEVASLCGRETALYCARVLQIDIERDSQSPFIMFEGLKDYKDNVIRNVQEFIEQHISDRITRPATIAINSTKRLKIKSYTGL